MTVGTDEIAIYDGSGTHPTFRGNRLHVTLNKLAGHTARSGRRHLYGTVSIYNSRSLNNHLSAGLAIKNLLQKYGGMWRLIIHEDLRAPLREPAGESRSVALSDPESHATALDAGLWGYRVEDDARGPRVRYARFPMGRASCRFLFPERSAPDRQAILS